MGGSDAMNAGNVIGAPSGGGMGGSEAVVTGGAGALGEVAGTGYDIYDKERQRKQQREDRDSAEQRSLRREANRRRERAYLSVIIDNYYRQQGWEPPVTNFPGQGTNRPLPGDQNPFAGYDVDPSQLTHQPLDQEGHSLPQNETDPNNSVRPDPVPLNQDKSEAEEALDLSPDEDNVDIGQGMLAAGPFKAPENKAKALGANLIAQAATNSPIAEDEFTSKPIETEVVIAPQKNNSGTTTPMPEWMRYIGRRHAY